MNLKDRSNTHTGLCQSRTDCQRSGLASVSSNATGEKLCTGGQFGPGTPIS